MFSSSNLWAIANVKQITQKTSKNPVGEVEQWTWRFSSLFLSNIHKLSIRTGAANSQYLVWSHKWELQGAT